MATTLAAAPSALKKQLRAEVSSSFLPAFKRSLSDLCLGHVDDAAFFADVSPKTLRDWINPHTDSCIPMKRLAYLLRGARMTWADAEQVADVWRAAMGEGFFAISVPGIELVREESRATVAAQLAGLIPDHLELLRSAVTSDNVTPFLRPANRLRRSEESTATAAG